MPYAFLERFDKPRCQSSLAQRNPEEEATKTIPYDSKLEEAGFESLIETAKSHKDMYAEKLTSLMKYYGAVNEEEILTGILRTKRMYLQRDNRRYGDMKDRITLSVKALQREVTGWFEKSCKDEQERKKLASAWYYVTYHPNHCDEKLVLWA